MSFYDSNINVIQSTRQHLYDEMKGLDLLRFKGETDRVRSIETKDGNLAVVIQIDGMEYRLNSAYKPEVEAMKWAGQFSFQNINIVVSMFGFGNGVFAREIMKHLGDQDVLLIYEPSMDTFLHTMENYDITDILSEERVSVSVEGINEQEYTTLINSYVTWINLESQMRCVHPQYDKLFKESYSNYEKVLKDVKIQAIVNKRTEAYWGEIMARNELRNLKYLKECNILSDFVEDIPTDVPAVIVSAGPSLDKNIEELKNAKGKACIIATDSALKYLLIRHIIPDFIITLDAKKGLWNFMDDRFKKIPLLCKTVSNPEILELHEGRKIFYYNETFVDTICRRLGKEQLYYNVGGCVATAAFSVCVGLGFRRIILVGQDLCYNGEVTHAGGIILNAHGSGEGAMIMVEDIYGNMVKARYDWYTYLLWFQEAIKTCPHIDVIDATEGGAKIKGAKIMSLSETIERYCIKNIDFEKAILEKEPAFHSEEELAAVCRYLKESGKDLDQIKQMAEYAVDICNRLIVAAEKDRIGTGESQAMVKKISRFNKEIGEKSIYQLINDFISNITTQQIDTIYQFTDNQVHNQVKTYTKAREVYKGIVEATKVMKPLLEETIKEFE